MRGSRQVEPERILWAIARGFLLLVQLAEAVNELLLCSAWCLVDFSEARKLSEHSPELGVNIVGAVAHHLEAATAFGTFWAEGGNHDVAARLQGVSHRGDIPDARLLVAEKVKHSAIVPEIKLMEGQSNPGDVTC